jgi:hypothetical protein
LVVDLRAPGNYGIHDDDHVEDYRRSKSPENSDYRGSLPPKAPFLGKLGIEGDSDDESAELMSQRVAS